MQTNNRRQRQTPTDPALVESIKQEVLAELHLYKYPQVDEMVHSNRTFAERIKQEVLQQVRRNEMTGQPGFQAQPQIGYPYARQALQDVRNYSPHAWQAPYYQHTYPSQRFYGAQYYQTHRIPYYPGSGMSYPDPLLVEAVKREVLAQMPADQEANEEQALQAGTMQSPAVSPHYPQSPSSGYYHDPYLIQSIARDVLSQMPAHPPAMEQEH